MRISFEIPASLVRQLKIDTPSNVSISLPNGIAFTRSSVGSDPLTLVCISAALSVPAGVLTGWLLNKLKDKEPQNMTINRRQIDYYESGKVKRIIEEEVSNRTD